MSIPKPVLSFTLVLISLLATVMLLFFPPIKQDISYHQFADQRTILTIPNFWNVITNVAFLWVGVVALYKLYKKRLQIINKLQLSYYIFFTAIALISLGSAYYHWQPNNLSLVWDRLPITLAFMSLLSFVIAENLSIPAGRNFLFPLLLLGLLSVLYWYFGELHGGGDLRLYALVQFLPLLLLLLLLVFGKTNFNNQSAYWWLFTAYVLAKLAEHFDIQIYQFTSGVIGGHAIKHIVSAAGLYIMMLCFEIRKRNI
jgi:hypothetical protein